MLLIDKPVGISSFGIVSAVRRLTGVKKVGHAGTLDPLASGLMIVLVGREETKKADNFLKLDKSYETLIRIGEQRTTGDLEGKIVACDTQIGQITRETANIALKSMIGTLRLSVPIYSAIKQGGQRLYTKARRGQEVKPPIRDMVIHNAELLDIKEVILWDSVDSCRRGYEIRAIFDVASGVYIRSLSEEFGKRLGYPATTASLRRISIGEYSVENAQILDNIKADLCG